MFNKCKIFVFFVCWLAIFPSETLQQRKNTKNVYTTDNENGKVTSYKAVSHWKSVTIIILSVLLLAVICYGTNCLYICQMTVCKRSERNYTKMDTTSQV